MSFCKKISIPTFVLDSVIAYMYRIGKTSTMSSNECEDIAKRVQNMSNLPVECKDIKHRPIVATSVSSSGSSIGSGGFLYTPTWEFLDEYSGK